MALMTLITNWRSGRMARRELASLDADGLEALARDVGVPSDQLARFASHGTGGELSHLLRAVGLVPERLARTHRMVMRDMSIVCSGCEAARRCRRDLDRGWTPVVQRYCPNAGTIKDLQAERCHAVS